MSGYEERFLPYSDFAKIAKQQGASDEEIQYLYSAYSSGHTKGLQTSTGTNFFLGEEKRPDAIWGKYDKILWASGEPLLIAGGDGVGKTTLAQQLALARARGGEELLGYPVVQDERRVVYVAADRPRQARRSGRRMITPDDHDILTDHFYVLSGGVHIDELLYVALRVEAGTLVIDTLGAVAPGDISTDAVGLQIYHAFQGLVAAGIEVVVLHHSRKRGEKWRGLEEVHGSRWITAALGSVLFLAGKPGSSELWLRHLKQPAESCGPMKLYHDHRRGKTYRE